MRRTLLIPAFVAVAALVAGSIVAAGSLAGGGERPPRADGLEDPARFVGRLVRLIGANRYAVAWQDLHPTHQHAARRNEYIACENTTRIPGRVERVQILFVRNERVRVPGTGRRVEGKAVGIRVVISDAIVPDGVVVEDTVSVVPAHHRWAWILPAQRFADYSADRCPGATPVSAR